MSEVTKPIHDEMTSLEELVQLNDSIRLATLLDNLLPVDIARKFFRLSKDEQIRLLELLGPEMSADMISKISGLGSTTIVEQLPSTRSSQIVRELPRDQQARLLRKIAEENAEAILEEIKPRAAKKIRKLMSYPDNINAIINSYKEEFICPS